MLMQDEGSTRITDLQIGEGAVTAPEPSLARLERPQPIRAAAFIAASAASRVKATSFGLWARETKPAS